MSEDLARPTYADFTQAAPQVYAGLAALTKAVDAAGLDKALTELVKVRVSQLNGCAFCLQFHLTLARKSGLDGRKLDLLAAWRDAGIYSAREQAALAWAEALTGLGPHAASPEAWAAVRAVFSQEEALYLTVTVAGINAWNRIGVGFGFDPPQPAG